jgi:hypothetical protein
MNDTTPETVAQWMLDEIERREDLFQIDAVDGIAKNFGAEFTYTNKNGNPAISEPVLAAFRKLHNGTMDWERHGRYWHKKQPGDPPGRRAR